jgi:hypothetical protein
MSVRANDQCVAVAAARLEHLGGAIAELCSFLVALRVEFR